MQAGSPTQVPYVLPGEASPTTGNPCSVISCIEKSSSGGSNVKLISFRMGLVTLLAGGLIAVCSSSAVAQDAAATYKAKCVMCHGPDGKGSAVGVKMGAHDFTSDDVQKQSDAQLAAIITKGKGKMPAYDGKLKDTEITGLVAYIRSLKK
jgi:mono/diheme cytochrome c family protein